MRIVSASMCGSSASYAYGRSGSSKAISGAPFNRLVVVARRICSASPWPRSPSTSRRSPRRELRPELYELDGISRASVEAHYKLYSGYVNKRNEILGRLAEVDLGTANQVYSDLRALKVDLTFAIGGIKNHELYFAHLGGGGGDPAGRFGALVKRDFGSIDAWRSRPPRDRPRRARLGVDGVRLGRRPPLQLHRRRPEHVPRLERDPARRARRLRARVLRATTRPTAPATSTRSSTTSTGTS